MSAYVEGTVLFLVAALATAGLGWLGWWLWIAPEYHPTWCRCRRCERATRAKTRRDARLRRATERQGRR